MQWNWQQSQWPDFSWDSARLEVLETRFQNYSGMLIGALSHVDDDKKDDLTVQIMSAEAIETSEIEGEFFNRDSVQSSIRGNLGLATSKHKATPGEQGIADMMVDLYHGFDAPLSHDSLFNWHAMITNGRTDLNDIGRYRTHDDPMQIVSGPDYARKVHYEAPPSQTVKDEMDRFIERFNSATTLPPLIKAGLFHLYFEAIHPFEDGNGRIGRAIAEKALSQNLGRPTLLALSHSINAKKRDYYAMLEKHNQRLEITDWLTYFGETILDAQAYAQKLVVFLIEKTKLFDRLRGQLNNRQEKALLRMFAEGPNGFKGGLSADNYITITGAARATATRDLADLVAKKALKRTGERRHTRYWLPIDTTETAA